MSGNGNTNGNGSTNGNGAYDPAAALRSLADAPRVGLEAAAAVLDRILALGRPRAPGAPLIPWDGTTNDQAPSADRRTELRHARADAERVLDAYGDWARQLLDGVFGLAEADGGGEVLTLGPATAGGGAGADLYLHAPPGRLTGPAPLRLTDLTSHTGAVICGAAASFAPSALLPSGAPATKLRVDVPNGTAPGVYYGHVLATGLPEVALAVRLEVIS